jgi:Na+/alanine symporter
VVVCAMTGLVLVNTGEWTKGLDAASLAGKIAAYAATRKQS